MKLDHLNGDTDTSGYSPSKKKVAESCHLTPNTNVKSLATRLPTDLQKLDVVSNYATTQYKSNGIVETAN